MKKKFTVTFECKATLDVEVVAETREEAMRIANSELNAKADNNPFYFQLTNESFKSIEDIPAIDELIMRATDIVKKAEEDDVAFTLKPWPTFDIDVFVGDGYETITSIAESVYEEDNEIFFETESGSEISLSELTEIQKLHICQQIIEQAKDNGIQED